LKHAIDPDLFRLTRHREDDQPMELDAVTDGEFSETVVLSDQHAIIREGDACYIWVACAFRLLGD
jgi:hypothetical protein